MTERRGGGGGMEWPRVPIDRIADDVQPGFACQPTNGDTGIPQLRTNNVSSDGHIDLTELKRVPATESQRARYVLRRGDILFNNTNSPALAGKTAFFDEDGLYLFSNHMTRIRLDVALADPRYVARYLHWAWGQGMFRGLITQWVNQAAINRAQLGGVSIPLPPLSEQRRIVEILDQADRLRRLRAQADAKAGRILPALFIKMFGDPATNPMGWPAGDLGDAILETQYGTSKRANTEGRGVLVVRMNNISASGMVELSDVKYVDLNDSELEQQRLKPSDLLFNRTNSADLVGKTGLWTQSTVPAVAASYLIRVRIDPAKALPGYVWALMNSAFVKTVLANKARRAVGMANINATELRHVPALFPPLRVQQAFSERLRTIDLGANGRRRSVAALGPLFGSLMRRAFSGALTASWREVHMRELLQEIDRQAKTLSQPT